MIIFSSSIILGWMETAKYEEEKFSISWFNTQWLENFSTILSHQKWFIFIDQFGKSFLHHDHSSLLFLQRRNLPRQTTDLSDSDILGETIRQNDATLDDLLARANQLENAVIKKVRMIFLDIPIIFSSSRNSIEFNHYYLVQILIDDANDSWSHVVFSSFLWCWS